MKFITSLFPLPALAGLSSAATVGPKYPKPPSITYLYTVNITGGDSYPVGTGPYGSRVVVPILGGSFSGPKLKGTLMPVGGEWGVFDVNSPPGQGQFHIDVRQTFKTDDGAYIQVIEGGSSQPGGLAYATMRFDTGSEKYYWMNNVVAFGELSRLEGGQISINTFMLGAPPK